MAAVSFDPDFASPADWAAMYRDCGLQVVPCHPPAAGASWKRPRLADWKSLQGELIPDATFSRWYGVGGEHASSPQMGFLTGAASGNIFVIDLDDHKSDTARLWWEGTLLVGNMGIEPETWQQRTGGGGRQLLFRGPPGWRAPTNRTAIKVDIRGQGGFAVLPPSLHESGRNYDWVPGYAPWECELADAPQWLIDAVESLVEAHGGHQEGEPVTRTASPSTDFDAFGARVDGREEAMRDLIWASILDWYRECPIRPPVEESEAKMREAYAVYERGVKSRLDGADKSALLEREGRGLSAFAAKWRYAMRKWDGEVAAEAGKAPPRQAPPRDDHAEPPKADPSQPNIPRFPFESVGDLRRLPPTTWLIDKWIPDGSTGIFYGMWAAGKSFLAFDIGLHLAYGMSDWHGAKLPAEPVEVLILAREGHQGFVARIDAFKAHHGIVDDPDRLTFMRASVSFMRDDEFSGLCEAIRSLGRKFKLVIVDTVARVLAGVDMNEQQTVTLFMERCQILAAVTGATAIGVHHQNKSGGMMGSIYFEANSDFVYEVTRLGDEDQPLREGEITCTKMKDGEDHWSRSIAYERIALAIDPDGPSSLVVKEVADRRQAEPAKGSRKSHWPEVQVCRQILAAIDEAWDRGRPWTTSLNTDRSAVRNIAIRWHLERAVVDDMVQTWIANSVIEMQERGAKKHMVGLRVTGEIG